ncbi:MAG: hypothetical protein ACRC20_01100 [Segniliparus sp.]|uniref:hypothetical protein n=1 Tax=Segniliparus sp. TaxID=2804064 RepID=UPI003F3C804F
MSYPQQGYGAPPQGGYGTPPAGYGPPPGPQGGYGYGQPGPYGLPPQPKEPADLGKIFGFSVLGLGSLIGLLFLVLAFLGVEGPQIVAPTAVAELSAALIVAFGLAAKSAPKSSVVVAGLSVAGAVAGVVAVVVGYGTDPAKLESTSWILLIVVFVLALVQAGLAAATVFVDKGDDEGDVKTETPPSQTQASPYAGPQQPIAPQSYEQPVSQQHAPQQSYAQAPAQAQQHGQQHAAAPSPYAQPVAPAPQAPSAPQPQAAPAPQAPATPPPAPASPYGIPAAGASAQPPASPAQPQINLGLGEPPRAH